MRKRRVLLGLIAILFFTINSLFASQADPTPRKIQLPDGTQITLIIRGDEKVRWAETVDGYTVLSDTDGFYKYAYRLDNDDLNVSEQIAHDPEKRNVQENAFLSKIERNLLYSKSQVSTLKSIWDIKRKEAAKGFPTTGERDLIMILIGYSDRAFTKSQTEFNNLMNQTGYSVNNASGSVQDYFSDNSFGELTLNTIVAGPYTAAHNMAYYGGEVGSDNDSDPRALVSEAIDLADADVDFSKADNDNDGYVDGVYILYAGYGEEAGGGDTAIWAHAWSLSSYVQKDGVKIGRYSCSAELSGNSGSTITNIGVICHEFSHVCGLPDFYDTDYEESGGQSFDLGGWDCMAGGSWNNGGKTPPFHNAYSRNALGWQTTTLLEETKDVELLNSAENNVSYKILTNTANEYFIMENRQKISWDEYVPHHGMLIYHVDENYSGWDSNDINSNPDHQGMDIEEADGTQTDGSTSGDPFPGTSNKTSFTDATTPNSLSWDGVATNKAISNITEANDIITFHIEFGSSTGGGNELLIMNFEDGEDLSDWTVLDGNSDDTKWAVYGSGGINDTKCGGYQYSETEAADDWLFSSAVSLEAGVEYEANFYYAVAGSDYPEKLSFYYDTDKSSALTKEIVDLGSITNETFLKSTNNLTVATTGTYYFGWYCYSDANQYAVFIDSVVIREKPAVVLEAKFTADVSSGITPLTVEFTDQSTGVPTAWSWDFNNDGTEDSDVQNPTFVYTNAGTYSVSLTVTNADGSDKATMTDYIEVVEPIVADFSVDTTSGYAPLTVDFKDLSAGKPTAWSWDFNNDGIEDSDVQNPTYIFTEAGLYTISLTASNSQSSDNVNKTDFIQVSAVGVNNKEANNWKLYPNPASSQIAISFIKNINDEAVVEIYNSNGQILFNKTFNNVGMGSDAVIDISEFENGIYYIKVLSGKVSSLEKLIIQ